MSVPPMMSETESLDEAALVAAERAFHHDDGGPHDNLAAAIRAYVARARPPEEPPPDWRSWQEHALSAIRTAIEFNTVGPLRKFLDDAHEPQSVGAAPLRGPSPEVMCNFHRYAITEVCLDCKALRGVSAPAPSGLPAPGETT